MAMVFTSIITPLKIEVKNNQFYIDQAKEKKVTLPTFQEFQELTYVSSYMDDVDGIEVPVSNVEKIKTNQVFDIKIKEPINAVIKFASYDMGKGHSISAKIIGIGS